MKWVLLIMLLVTMIASLLAFLFHYMIFQGYEVAKAIKESERKYE
jgi:RsiW-degrading membrane proteinase PrsW (M82 family)